ncbi:MAG: MliC family protein [Paracoccus sp. (in: a-proteobacteria)]|nr:MliC family protein [Paracoccus sp. (in: a-proteobacteria)]
MPKHLIAMLAIALPAPLLAQNAPPEVMIPDQPYQAVTPYSAGTTVTFAANGEVLVDRGGDPELQGHWKRGEDGLCVTDTDAANTTLICGFENARGDDGSFHLAEGGDYFQFQTPDHLVSPDQPDRPAVSGSMFRARYDCPEGRDFDAVFINAGGDSFAVVELAQLIQPLGIAVSGSGARYLSGDGQVEFWTKGDEATLTLYYDGTARVVHDNCRAFTVFGGGGAR